MYAWIGLPGFISLSSGKSRYLRAGSGAAIGVTFSRMSVSGFEAVCCAVIGSRLQQIKNIAVSVRDMLLIDSVAKKRVRSASASWDCFLTRRQL